MIAEDAPRAPITSLGTAASPISDSHELIMVFEQDRVRTGLGAHTWRAHAGYCCCSSRDREVARPLIRGYTTPSTPYETPENMRFFNGLGLG